MVILLLNQQNCKAKKLRPVIYRVNLCGNSLCFCYICMPTWRTRELKKMDNNPNSMGQTRKFTSIVNVGKANGNQVEALYDAK